MRSRNNVVSFSFLWMIISVFIFVGCHKSSPPPELPTSPVDTTTTTKPSDSTENLGFGNGVDLQPSYYNNGNVSFGWSLMKQYPKIKTVRIEIEPSVNIDLAESWIAAAISNGYKVIATYHNYKVLGSDNLNDLLDAANWWKANYDTLAKAGPFMINLMNEWGSGNLSAQDYANDYNQAISIVRTVYDSTIIIDCPGYGQGTLTAANAVKGIGGTAIKDTNIILSVHVYPNGYNTAKGRYLQASDLNDIIDDGIKGIIGEFGNQPANGQADWSGIVNYAKSKGWPVIGWAWNGDGGSMNMVTPSWSQDPQANSFQPGIYFDTIYSRL